MKSYKTENIRNIAVMGHGGCGKTTLMEAMLFKAGHTTRIGDINQGTSICDYEPDEVKRQTSIYLKIVPVEWRDTKINFIDTPGYADFIGELLCGIRASDSALIVVSAVSGVETQTQKVWGYAEKSNMPRAFFINKCDRDGIDFNSAVDSIKNTFSDKAVPFQIPIEPGPSIKGIVDVLRNKAILYNDGKSEEADVPDDLKDSVEELKSIITEAAVESDDDLLEKYLDSGEVSEDELNKAILSAFTKGMLYPIFCGVATSALGISELLNSAVTLFPSPDSAGEIKAKNEGEEEVVIKSDSNEMFSGLVFKVITEQQLGELSIVRLFSGSLKQGGEIYNSTKGSGERVGHMLNIRGKNREEVEEVFAGDIVALPKLKNTELNDTLCTAKNKIKFEKIPFPEPVVSFAIKAATRKDQEKLANAFSKVLGTDPTLKITQDPEFNQTIIMGMGDVHIDIIMNMIKERYGIEAKLEKPLIHYRETIKKNAEARYRHKKQSGGAGQFGEVALRISPLERGKNFEFVNDIVGGAIPSQYIPSCEKGVVSAMKEGVLAGYPVVDVQVSVWDGKYHPVDSKDIAFQIAGRTAFKMAMEDAKPVMLEPINNIEITVPDKYTGDVTGNLNSRRGRIEGIEPLGDFQIIKAKVPEAEVYGYSGDLRSMTQGSGSYTMSFSHYEEIPPAFAKKIIEEAKKHKEEADE